jgi:NitT/TauT family transport system substrate-binding protein
VGVEPNAVGTFLLARALEMSGLTVDDIQVVPLTLEEHERGFLHRQVDAVVTFEPRRSRLLAAGAVQIFNSSQIPGEIVDVMAVRQELIDRRSKAVESLVKGWFRAVDYMKAQPEAAARVMAARENITPEEFQRSLTGLEIPDLEANLRLLGEGEDNLARRLRHLSAVMMSRKLLRSEVDTQTLIENRFVKRMKP